MRQHLERALAAALLLSPPLTLASCASPSEPERLTAVVRERLDFDPSSFTQGLEVAPGGGLYVGTGMWGESRVYFRGEDGTEGASASMSPELFGEGITLVDDHLWQLTWQDGTAFKRDPRTLEEIGRAHYQGEGWGICYREDAGEVLLSDGTSRLRRMDPDTLEELDDRGVVEVTEDGEPVAGLNELECVGGDVYANIFTTTDIVRIDADTGKVTARIDASGLPNRAGADPDNVLNGIAHIPGTDEFYLTGKRWPDLYRVSFEPAD